VFTLLRFMGRSTDRDPASVPTPRDRNRDNLMTPGDRSNPVFGAPAWYTSSVAILLAMLSAVMYGVSDYVGGRASRRSPAVAVALAAELVMLVVCVVCIPLFESESLTARAATWGLVAGLVGSAGVLGLYVALARGNMTVVAPVTGVVAAIVPVVVGISLGERPSAVAMVGVLIAIVAVALIGGIAALLSDRRRAPIDPATIALAVGVGIAFGLLFVALSRTGDDSGLWPIMFSRFTGLPLLVVAYVVMQRGQPRPVLAQLAVPAMVIGGLVAGSNVSYLVSTRHGLLSVVAVVVAMYPAATIGLAALLDGERASRSQLAGMALAVVALVAVTGGA
jgi:drug/metabolite transporter (DMT)-like permease